MKKDYQKPEYEIILLNRENVITESGGGQWETGSGDLNSAKSAKSVWDA